MQKGSRSFAKAPAEAVRILWEEGFFNAWHNLKYISETLGKRGNNFSSAALGTALSRANYLTRRGKRGEMEYAQKRPAETRARGEVKQDIFNDYDLHKRIEAVVGMKYQDGHYAEAVESAFKEIIKRVKDYVNERSKEKFDGAKAMGRAFDFDRQEPLIKFNGVKSDEEKDEQRGIALLFKGIVFIRNRKAHENITLDDPNRACEYLALASLLMRLLDEYAK